MPNRIIPTSSKMCNACHLVKPLDEFREVPTGSARRNRCKECNNKIDAKRTHDKRVADPEFVAKLTDNHRCYVGTRRGYSSTRITNLRRKAKKQNLDFDLDPVWLENKLAVGKCEMSGIEFNYMDLNFIPSVDRVDPTSGYIKTNCRVVLYCLNAFKGTMTDSQCRKIAKVLIDGSNV